MSKPLFIADSHHKVLPAWASLTAQLNQAPRLITLDHHTDTSKPFRRYIAKMFGQNITSAEFTKYQSQYLDAIDYKDPESVIEAVTKLNNDEHIVAAIKANIISSAFVIAHSAADTDLQIYKQHNIICHSVDEEPSTHKPKHDIVLESNFLNKAISAFNDVLGKAYEEPLSTKPYILDIDLDYFNTFKSIKPDNPETIKRLIQNAELVTIATEPEYVKHCAVDDKLTSEYLLDALKEIIS